MLFSSISFLYYFLPFVLLVYFLVPTRVKNYVILCSSLFFYAWGEPQHIRIMLLQILVGYITGRLMDANAKRKKQFLVTGITICLGILGYYKYAGFLTENLNHLTGAGIPIPQHTLPLGISFYTFQIISYMVDVYRRDSGAQRNIATMATYVVMFPQLVAGPILRYSDIEQQLQKRSPRVEQIALGIRRFILGLGKKIIIADSLGLFCELFRDSQDSSLLYLWGYVIANALQIYFDFSGYSDMAIGLGHIFGFQFKENFRYPFLAKSMTEFWQRWHISLGSWFRDYLYIPLGGNRVRKLRWFCNILIVWFLTGLWHGAAWNFVVWGLFFAFFLVLEKACLLKILKKRNIISHIYVLVFILISFVIFSATNMQEAITYLKNMFGFGGLPLLSEEGIYYIRSYSWIFVMSFLGATPLPSYLFRKMEQSKKFKIPSAVFEIVGLLILFIMITAYLVDGSFQPFLYFRF